MASRYRPCSVINNAFVLIVLFMIGFIYYTTMVLIWAPRVVGKFKGNVFVFEKFLLR